MFIVIYIQLSKIIRKIWPFLLIALLCWGCKSSSKNNAVLKDVWRLEQAQINSFDPQDAYHAYHIQLTKQLFNTLTDVDTIGRIVPSLASNWYSEDGCHWIFELRKNVLFVNDKCFDSTKERLFTAQDVKYTFERLLNKDSQSLGISYFTNILGVLDYRNGKSNAIQGIKVIDNYTVSFVLNKINYNFPNLLSLPFCSIVKKKAIEAYDPKVKPIGTGPFRLESYVPDSRIFLVRNNDYWERMEDSKVPFVKGVEIFLTTNDNYSFLLFKNKKTDFVELNMPLHKQNDATKYTFKTYTSTFVSTQLNFYLFNLSKIGDRNVRKGINYAINRDKIQDIIGKEGEVTHSLYPKMFKELYRESELLRTDEKKAQELLFGKLKKIKLVVFNDILSRTLAAHVKDDLAQFGMYVDIEAVPFAVLADRLSSGDYDIIQLYWGMLYADPDNFLTPFKTSSFPPEGNNFNKYENTKFEELIKSALLNEGVEQAMLYKRAEDVILDDMPFILLYYKDINLLSNMHFRLPVNPLLNKFYKYASLNN